MRQRFSQIIALAVGLFIGMGCYTPLPAKNPIQTSPLNFSASSKNKVSHVFVVTDASGTMYSESTFPEAKALTQSFVPAMPATPRGYQAALFGFGGQEQAGTSLSAFDRASLQNAADNLTLLGDINGMGGTTPLDQVFQSINQMLSEEKGLVTVVLISDHQPDSPAAALSAAEGLVNSYRDGVCIHTVHVGDSEDGATFAKSLSELTSCGSTRAAGQLTTASAFNGLAKDVFYSGGHVIRNTSVDPCRGDFTVRGANFEFNKATLAEDGREALGPVAEQLNQCSDVSVEITGHTDSVGNNEYNQGLSERRANAVKDYLVSQGVTESRLTSNGQGEGNPITSNATAEGRAQNRRVELHPVKSE